MKIPKMTNHKHFEAMALLQEYWIKNKERLIKQHQISEGMRSSQIAAIMGVLIDLKIITIDQLKELVNK